MSLQSYLSEQFENWTPSQPTVLKVSRQSVTLSWEQSKFSFVRDQLLYKVERKNKFPPWLTVYSGGKTSTTIYDLTPSSPFKFRLKVILKPSAVPDLEKKALEFYGNEKSVFDSLEYEEEEVIEDNGDGDKAVDTKKNSNEATDSKGLGSEKKDENNTGMVTDINKKYDQNDIVEHGIDNKDKTHIEILENTNYKEEQYKKIVDESNLIGKLNLEAKHKIKSAVKQWLESRYSEEIWTRTESEGSSVLQSMLEVRPELIELTNPSNGLTPLITAVMKGDLTTVQFLLSCGADVEQQSLVGHSPLHLALLSASKDLVEMLMDKGARFESCDRNGLRAEHYAADSGSPAMVRLVRERGGDFSVTDNNGWTPLFRAVCQNASTDLIEALLWAGSDPDVTDCHGLHLNTAARLLVNHHGAGGGDTVLRLLDAEYPRELAQANFTRLSKKINTVHTVFRH